MSALRAIYLVARREFLAYAGAWGFWLSLATTPALLAALIFAPMLLRQAEPTRLIAIVSDAPAAGAAIRDAIEKEEREALRGAVWTYAQSAAPARAEAAIAAFDAAATRDAAIAGVVAALGPAGAAFQPPAPRYRIAPAPAADSAGVAPYLTGARTIDGAPLFAALFVRGPAHDLRLEYWSANLTDAEIPQRARAALKETMRAAALGAHGLAAAELQRIESLAPAYAQFDPRAGAGAAVTTADRAPYLAAIALAFVLWSAVIGVANMLLTGVIEEKSNKILDALLASVTPMQILIGKLLGVALVSATLFSVWGVFALGALKLTGASAGGALGASIAAAALSPPLAAAFVFCFACGYLLYGALFLGLGALCDSLQEAQSLLGPVFLLLTAPVLLLGPAFSNPNAPTIEAASWVPLFAPFVLMMRAPAGLSFADAAGPFALLIVALVAVVWLSARAFRAGVAHETSLADLRRRIFPRRP